MLRAVFPALPARDVTFRLRGRPEVVAGPVLVVADDPELKVLARDDALGRRLAEATGGDVGDFTDLGRFLAQAVPKRTVRRDETIWRLWDAWIVLGFILTVLTVEWVYRKLVGLA